MSADWLTDLTAWLNLNPGWLAGALFLAAFVESLAIAGMFVPGVAILFAVAALAGQAQLPLSEALLSAGLGAIAGDTISFALGRLLQGRLTSLWPVSRYPHLITRGERFFLRHGGKSVVIGRFVGPVRPIIPMIAGALLMPWPRFLTFNIASAIGWAPAYILPGFLVGSTLASELRLPPYFYGVIGISLGALLAVYLLLIRVQAGLGEGGWLYLKVKQALARYEASHRFWRLYSSERPAQAGEFPLASFTLALGASGLFLLWSQLAVHMPWLDAFDTTVLLWFGELRHPMMDGPAIAATLLGDPPVLLAAAGLAILVLAFRGYYAAALHVLLAGALTVFLVSLMKFSFGVDRPDLVVNPPESGAFPSGHAAGITVFVTLLASFVAGESHFRNRWQSYVLLSLPLVPVAVSRLYLGVHWFSDVVGGVLLGLAITGWVRASYSRFDRVPLALEPVTLSAAVAWLAFCAGYLMLEWSEAVRVYAAA